MHASQWTIRHDSGRFRPWHYAGRFNLFARRINSLSLALCLALVSRAAQRSNPRRATQPLQTPSTPRSVQYCAKRLARFDMRGNNQKFGPADSQPRVSSEIAHQLVNRHSWEQQSLELRSFVPDTQCHLHKPFKTHRRVVHREHSSSVGNDHSTQHCHRSPARRNRSFRHSSLPPEEDEDDDRTETPIGTTTEGNWSFSAFFERDDVATLAQNI